MFSETDGPSLDDPQVGWPRMLEARERAYEGFGLEVDGGQSDSVYTVHRFYGDAVSTITRYRVGSGGRSTTSRPRAPGRAMACFPLSVRWLERVFGCSGLFGVGLPRFDGERGGRYSSSVDYDAVTIRRSRTMVAAVKTTSKCSFRLSWSKRTQSGVRRVMSSVGMNPRGLKGRILGCSV